ncbi:helix-turn-helix domain-containing protein [Demequina sp.]|uniref:helix-turn-helix domain-containing protein n=1 Tax=Demequina sp. TaxID=2050685 RepID=UPI003D0C8888
MTTATAHGDVVLVSGRVAALLIALPDFTPTRIGARGTPEYEQLVALYKLGLENSVPRTGTLRAPAVSSVPTWITTEQAAALLGITTRAVTKRLAAGQLDGEKHGSRWRVNRRAIERQLGRRHT